MGPQGPIPQLFMENFVSMERPEFPRGGVSWSESKEKPLCIININTQNNTTALHISQFRIRIACTNMFWEGYWNSLNHFDILKFLKAFIKTPQEQNSSLLLESIKIWLNFYFRSQIFNGVNQDFLRNETTRPALYCNSVNSEL